ncbi:uncharacterized protein LOC112565944 [Pomacea canaliculata]|uniref:uncharacterized protein LOC112565944 n=1 Tax=Pomacea canaliculata TaxID=400727 RepID=UPI000D73B812|nr:uncharacterized protein LOC112565944 [Pomacea canaliculata]
MKSLSNSSLADNKGDTVLPWDNPLDPVSYEDYKLFNLVAQCVVKPLVFAAGIPSNIINTVVFWRQGLTDRMNFCLFCLALADLLYLLSLLGVTQIGPFIEITDVLLGKEVYYKSLQFGLGIRDEMRTMAGCITLVIAIERCVCVYLPLRASSLMRTRTMAALLASIYVFTQLGFVYSFFHYDIYAKRSNSTNQTLYWVLELSTTYKKNYLLFRGFEVCLLTILPPCIFISMCLATAATILKLRTAILWRQKTSSMGSGHQVQQMALMKMLVLVSCIYIVTSIPYVALIMTSAFILDFDLGGRYQNSFLTMAMMA